jgi:hypothetical protein
VQYVRCSMYGALCTVQYVRYSMYGAVCTVQYVRYSMYGAVCTVQYVALREHDIEFLVTVKIRAFSIV